MRRFELPISRATTWRLNRLATPTTHKPILAVCKHAGQPFPSSAELPSLRCGKVGTGDAVQAIWAAKSTTTYKAFDRSLPASPYWISTSSESFVVSASSSSSTITSCFVWWRNGSEGFTPYTLRRPSLRRSMYPANSKSEIILCVVRSVTPM